MSDQHDMAKRKPRPQMRQCMVAAAKAVVGTKIPRW